MGRWQWAADDREMGSYCRCGRSVAEPTVALGKHSHLSVPTNRGNYMNRLKTGLGMLAATGALALAVATPASAGQAGGGLAPATPGTAITKADRPVPAGAIKVGGAGSASPTARTSAGIGTGHATNAHQDGFCNNPPANVGDGDFCLWFLSNFGGSYSDFFFADTNLTDNVFITAGSGQGQTVAANAESALNADSNLTARVCTGVGQTGSCNIVPPRGFGNFVAPYFNGVRSFLWQ